MRGLSGVRIERGQDFHLCGFSGEWRKRGYNLHLHEFSGDRCERGQDLHYLGVVEREREGLPVMWLYCRDVR